MIGTKLLTLLKGREVGEDEFGNKYYEEKFLFPSSRHCQPRRWVCYKGIAEGSKVPASWHGWLHFTTNKTPVEIKRNQYTWEKSHMPNLSGTRQAYGPNVNRQAQYYEAWQPDSKT